VERGPPTVRTRPAEEVDAALASVEDPELSEDLKDGLVVLTVGRQEDVIRCFYAVTTDGLLGRSAQGICGFAGFGLSLSVRFSRHFFPRYRDDGGSTFSIESACQNDTSAGHRTTTPPSFRAQPTGGV